MSQSRFTGGFSFRFLLVCLTSAITICLLFVFSSQMINAANVTYQSADYEENSIQTATYAYIALSSSNKVSIVNMDTHTESNTINVEPSGCFFPWRATMSPNGEVVYVSCYNSGNVVVIDTSTNTISATIGSIQGADGIAFTRNGRYALVGSRNATQVAVIDTKQYTVTQYITTTGVTRSIAAHPYLNRAYVTSSDGYIRVVDTTTFNIFASINVGGDPWDVAVSSDGQWVFAGDRQGSGLAVIDASTNNLHTNITGLGELSGLDVAPDGSKIYAGHLYNGLHIIDGNTFSLLTTVTNIGTVWETAVACDGNEVYVGNRENQVPVINTATNALITNITLSDYASRGIAACPQYVTEGVVVSPPTQTKQGALGESVSYESTLINATGTTDSFTVTVGSNIWETSFVTTTIGPLAYGESVTFTVPITIPDTANWHDTDTAVIQATSVTSPTIYTDTSILTTEAYAPAKITVAPNIFTTTQLIHEITTQTMTISNGLGVDLDFEISTHAGSGVAPFVVSTELYGYDLPYGTLRLIGTEDDTSVQVINLGDGSLIAEENDLDRYEVWEIYPDNGTYYKIESDKPVLGIEASSSNSLHATFIPSLDANMVGQEFIFQSQYYYYDSAFYIYAIEDADIEMYHPNGILAMSASLNAGEYLSPTNLQPDVYHVYATGKIAMQYMDENGYTTVPDTTGTGVGDSFYFATDYWTSGAFLVFAYENVDIQVYDLDTDDLLWETHVNAGDSWWQTDVGTRRLYLESTGLVEVWAGATENGTSIEHLGDDISFAAGLYSQEYFLHSLMDGFVIFAPFNNTTIHVDDQTYNLDKDEYVHLTTCCTFHNIRATQPILIQTLGGDSGWNDFGTYLGGLSQYNASSPTWLSLDPITGTVGMNADTSVTVRFDATNLQPGLYTADVIVSNNDPVNSLLTLPVSMTVEPTVGMGWVEGYVTDSRTGLPVNATVIAMGQPYTITTDMDTGYYKLWLDAGSYTLQIDAEGYVGETTAVAITAQQATTQNIQLVLDAPVLDTNPASMSVTQDYGQSDTQTLTITNDGPASLTFEIQNVATGFTPVTRPIINTVGGPDSFGYMYRDSMEPDGPTYEWEEIQNSGTQINGWTDYLDYGRANDPVPIGFEFDYYGNPYTELYVHVSGYVSFGQGYGSPIYDPLPNNYTPNNEISLYSGGLYLNNYGSDSVVYYETKENPRRFILEYVNLYHCCSTYDPPKTFQLILFPNGNILTQYKELGGGSPYYIGIENETGQVGLQYSNTITDELAICYAYPTNLTDCRYGEAEWLNTSVMTGTVPAYNSVTVDVTMDASQVQPGTHNADLIIQSNDPLTPTAVMPVTMIVNPIGTMGRVTGSITDAWTGDPLKATVELAGVYTSDGETSYSIWAEAGSYTLMAHTPGYYTQTHTITITEGIVTSYPIALEPAQSRMEMTVSNITATAVAGHQNQQTFTIMNSGPLPLQVDIFEFASETARPTLANNLAGKQILYDAYHGANNADYTTLIQALTDEGANVDALITSITDEKLAGYDVLIITQNYNYSWTVNELLSLKSWLNTGGAVLVQGEDSSATNDPAGLFEIYYESASGCYYGDTTTNIIRHIISYGINEIYSGDPCSKLQADNGDHVVFDPSGDLHVVAQQQDGGKMVVVNNNAFNNWTIEQNDNLQFALNIIEWLAAPAYSDIDWLTASPTSMLIEGHDTMTFTVEIDATLLPIGTYEANLAIENDDPAKTPVVTLPVSLNVVQQLADASVTANSLIATVDPGTTAVYTLTITNMGNAADSFTIASDSNWATTISATTTGVLEPNESFILTVQVTAPTSGSNSSITSITITSTFDESIIETIDLTTTISTHYIYLPVIVKP